MRQYERRLPHWDAIGRPLFVTFRLHGTLPANRAFPPAIVRSAGKAFVVMDRILDSGKFGPTYLRIPEIADVVVKAIRDCQKYDLHAFVVMPNHVHLLVTAHVPAAEWLGPLKGYTARAANLLLNQTGKHFWQDESYDHLVRSPMDRIQNYIEFNPVKAGLSTSPETFLYSSAFEPPEGGSQPGLAAPLLVSESL